MAAIAPAATMERTNEQGGRSADIPIILQLIIPFLPAGDLGDVAALNRACRRAAVESYQKRLGLVAESSSPSGVLSSEGGENKDNRNKARTNPKTTTPIVFEHGTEVPKCYRPFNPWSHLDYLKMDIGEVKRSAHFSIETQEESAWKISWKAPPWMLKWHHGILQRPAELAVLEGTTSVHRSLRGTSLLVIVSKRVSLSGNHQHAQEDDESYDQDTAKELWGIFYDLTPPPASAAAPPAMSQPAPPIEDLHRTYHPVRFHKLLPQPKSIEWSANYDTIEFGEACRSGNGKAIAVVTAIPHQEYIEEGPVEVTIFDVKEEEEGLFVPRCVVSVETFNAVGDYSGVELSLSTDGEVLSVLNEEKYDREGSWTVHDVRGDSAQEILRVEGVAAASNYLCLLYSRQRFCHERSRDKLSMASRQYRRFVFLCSAPCLLF